MGLAGVNLELSTAVDSDSAMGIAIGITAGGEIGADASRIPAI
jgi:hypothetical protein